MNELPPEIPHLSQALTRLRLVFQGTLGVELMDTEVAQLAGLDDDECRILLAVLEQTGAIERPRSHVFVCHRSSWWTAARVRSQPPRADEDWLKLRTRAARASASSSPTSGRT